MTSTTNATLVSTLAHHGICLPSDSDDTATDNAREAGLIYACLGCGTVGGIDPTQGEAARVATRDALDHDELCCEDASQVVF